MPMYSLMISARVRNELRARTEILTIEEQYAVAEGIKDEVLIGEYMRRYEEAKESIRAVKESFKNNMEEMEV